MKELKNYPKLPYASERPAVEVSTDMLTSINVNTGAFGIHENDIISFDNDESVIRQQISKDNNGKFAYYITCTRNGKNSLVSASQLIRRAYDNEDNLVYVGPLQAKLAELPSLKEQLETIAGKTFVGSEPREFKFAVFENGIRTEKKETRRISVLTERE